MAIFNDIKLSGKKQTRSRTDALAMFENLFQQFFQPLVTYAYRFVNDWQTAEDITQDVFMSLWLKKEEINFEEPIKPYLYRSIYNKAINYLNSALIQKRIDRKETLDEMINREIMSYNQYDTLLLKEITNEITSFVETLPPQCKKVFEMSRGQNLKNKEIAEQLNISEKAVEKHISKALNEIREHLIKMDMMPALIWLILLG